MVQGQSASRGCRGHSDAERRIGRDVRAVNLDLAGPPIRSLHAIGDDAELNDAGLITRAGEPLEWRHPRPARLHLPRVMQEHDGDARICQRPQALIQHLEVLHAVFVLVSTTHRRAPMRSTSEQ